MMNDKGSIAHEWWCNSVLGYNIMVAEHIKGEEVMKMAVDVHTERRHFHHDTVKLILMDRIESPWLDGSILRATIARCLVPNICMRASTPLYDGTHSNCWWGITTPCLMGRGVSTQCSFTSTHSFNGPGL
jgi:hypothetical protein